MQVEVEHETGEDFGTLRLVIGKDDSARMIAGDTTVIEVPIYAHEAGDVITALGQVASGGVAAYGVAVQNAADLLRDGSHGEYRRGILNLLGDLYGVAGVDGDTRQDEIEADIDRAIANS